MASTSPTGLIGSLRELGDGFVASVHDRVELLSLDLQEEKFRLIRIFVWISVLVFTGLMAILFASVTLVYFFWDSARIAVLCGLTVLHGGGFACLLILFRRHLAREPRPFAGTLEELEHDRACIRGDN